MNENIIYHSVIVTKHPVCEKTLCRCLKDLDQKPFSLQNLQSLDNNNNENYYSTCSIVTPF